MKFFIKEGEYKHSKEIVEEVAEMLHIWYLEATKDLNPKSFNSKAQKQYKDLTENQKQIDRYIAKKVLILIEDIFDEVAKDINNKLKGVMQGC